MKCFLLPFILLASLSALAQQPLPDNFKIGQSIEVFNKDSIKIYYSCTGSVADEKCAEYYRIGKMDTAIANVTGEFSDYYKDGHIFLKATMKNNYLEGKAQYYHQNDTLKEEGNYEKSKRRGRWTFYYPNGQIQQVYYYGNDEPIVLAAYEPDGTATVIKGNGSFTTEFSFNLRCDKLKTSGNVVQGQKEGAWTYGHPNTYAPMATEIFEHGKFIKGTVDGKDYPAVPRITLTNFYASEALFLSHNTDECYSKTMSYWDYNNKSIYTSYFPPLQEKLATYGPVVKDQWLIVGIKLRRNNQIEELNIASSINDKALEAFAYTIISKMKKWSRKHTFLKADSNFFFSIVVANNQIIIPVNYIYREMGN